MKIVIDDKIPFIKGALEPHAHTIYLPGGKISPSDIADADALITRTRTKCNESLLKGSKIKFIATATIGFDHIDIDYCQRAGISWANAPGCNSSSVMQYLASALASISQKKSFILKGKTLGIIGVGNVGSKVARVGKAFEMNVLLNDPPRERREGSGNFVPLKKLITESDIISLHVPLIRTGIDRTFHLINEETLSWMKSETILINTSRGEVVEEAGLLKAMKTGKISGAVLDVWEKEPQIDRELLSLVDIGTPHIAGYSLDGKANGTAMAVQAISRYFGLGLDQWRPMDVPLPENPVFKMDDNYLEEGLKKAILHTYNVMEDDCRLRNDVDSFEQQRGNYPPRREFPSYTVELKIKNSIAETGLKLLGFHIS